MRTVIFLFIVIITGSFASDSFMTSSSTSSALSPELSPSEPQAPLQKPVFSDSSVVTSDASNSLEDLGIASPAGVSVPAKDLEEHETKEINYKSMIKQLEDGLYVGKIKDKSLWLVMEQVTDANIKDWQQYAAQQNSIHLGSALLLSKGANTGAQFFQDVLSGTSHTLNEMWIAYITSDKAFQSNITKGYKLIKEYKGESSHPAQAIRMFVTVTSGPEADITSHLGISMTHEHALLLSEGKGNPGISMDLHSFAAKVMLSRKPDRRYMINSPTPKMGSIIAKFVPKVFIGTIEQIAARNSAKSSQKWLTFDEFKTQMNSEGEIDDAYLQTQKKKLKQNMFLSLYKEKKQDKEVEKIMRSSYLSYKSHVGDFLGSLQQEMSLSNEDFEKYLEAHPPILSATYNRYGYGGIENLKKLVIYDQDNREKEWLEISRDKDLDMANYDWMFSKPFLPGWVTYIAVNLAELANAVEHEKQ